jgi:GntR family transcriptional regulator
MKKQIDKNIGIPLYEQILEIIYNDIQNGVFAYGEIIPKEMDLCKMYNVSRPTIRKAMDILVQNGNLIRIKGKGTYVSSDKKIKQEFTHIIQNFNAEMSQKGVSPGTKVSKKASCCTGQADKRKAGTKK